MKGVVVNFNQKKGFGFIRTPETTKDVFFHISEIKHKQIPVVGQTVEFELIITNKGPAGTKLALKEKWWSPLATYGFLVVLLVIIISGYLLKYMSLIWAYIFAVNITTIVIFLFDKIIASTSMLRVPEVLLHVLAISGGSPASFAAQNIFRHKTLKSSFQRNFWLIVAIQSFILILLAYF
jgi:uncharacterized membrane protein YsdA (DUF1294 family)/cold shock CspA family protein